MGSLGVRGVLPVTATRGDSRPVTREKNPAKKGGAPNAKKIGAVRIRKGVDMLEFKVPRNRVLPVGESPFASEEE
jgi:hypothetical protein